MFMKEILENIPIPGLIVLILTIVNFLKKSYKDHHSKL
jgi:hypothetical protein